MFRQIVFYWKVHQNNVQEDQNSLVRLAEERPFRENKPGAAAKESKPMKIVLRCILRCPIRSIRE